METTDAGSGGQYNPTVQEVKSPIYTQETPNEGRISDVGAAQEVAQIEDQMGRDAALKREGELAREAVTGLTDVEKRNVDVINGLQEKYPDAFDTLVDDNGEKTLLANFYSKRSNGEDISVLFFNKEGCFVFPSFSKEKFKTDVDITKINEKLKFLVETDGLKSIFAGEQNPEATIDGREFIKEGRPDRSSAYSIIQALYERPDVLSGIKEQLAENEKRNKAEKSKANTKISTASDVLSQL